MCVCVWGEGRSGDSRVKTDSSHIRTNNELPIAGTEGFVLSVVLYNRSPNPSCIRPLSHNCPLHAPLNNGFGIIPDPFRITAIYVLTTLDFSSLPSTYPKSDL